MDAWDKCENNSHMAMIFHLFARVGFIKIGKFRLLVTSCPVCLGFIKISMSHWDFILYDIPPPIIKHNIHVFPMDELFKIRDKCELLLKEKILSN